MAIAFIDVNQTTDITLEHDKEDPTVFECVPIKARDMSRIAKVIHDERYPEAWYEICRLCVRNVRNAKNQRGDNVPWKPEMLEGMDIQDITALGTKIYDLNQLGGDDIKN